MNVRSLLTGSLLAAGLSLAATSVLSGQAKGTIDDHSVDFDLDCSGWQGQYLTATSTGADKNVHFDVTLFAGQNRLAVTYKPEEKRYQLLFKVAEASDRLEVSDTFTNHATGENFDAKVSLDCRE